MEPKKPTVIDDKAEYFHFNEVKQGLCILNPTLEQIRKAYTVLGMNKNESVPWLGIRYGKFLKEGVEVSAIWSSEFTHDEMALNLQDIGYRMYNARSASANFDERDYNSKSPLQTVLSHTRKFVVFEDLSTPLTLEEKSHGFVLNNKGY